MKFDMTTVLPVFALLLLISGCSGTKPGPYPNFWTQCVKFKITGFYAVSEAGPTGLGTVEWERNVSCASATEHSVVIGKP